MSPSDAWLTTKVKAALVTAEGVPWADVHVDTVDGLVTLHGSVATATERTRAQRLRRAACAACARCAICCKWCRHRPRQRSEVADDVLTERVKGALAADHALADSQIAVQSVNKGVVLLSGTAASLSDHVRALEDTARVAGVKQVASQIRSPAKFVDSELWHDGSFDLDLSKRSSAADLWVTTAVKERLLASNLTPFYGINVDTRDGVVTLFGVVDSKPARDSVIAEVRKTPGVRKVSDSLQIVPPEREDVVAETDEVIQAAIAKRIQAEPRAAGLARRGRGEESGGPPERTGSRFDGAAHGPDARAHDARRARAGRRARAASHAASGKLTDLDAGFAEQPIEMSPSG